MIHADSGIKIRIFLHISNFKNVCNKYDQEAKYFMRIKYRIEFIKKKIPVSNIFRNIYDIIQFKNILNVYVRHILETLYFMRIKYKKELIKKNQ